MTYGVYMIFLFKFFIRFVLWNASRIILF